MEYVGLGALSTMLVSGIAAAIDSHAASQLAEGIVRRLLEAISTGG